MNTIVNTQPAIPYYDKMLIENVKTMHNIDNWMCLLVDSYGEVSVGKFKVFFIHGQHNVRH